MFSLPTPRQTDIGMERQIEDREAEACFARWGSCSFAGHVCGVRQLWPRRGGPPLGLFAVFSVLSPVLCQQQGELRAWNVWALGRAGSPLP